MKENLAPTPVKSLSGIPFSYPAGPAWFAVRTNIRCETRAQLGLDASGFRTYLPQCIKWISHARMKERVKRPLFARYLFVELDINKRGTDDIRRTNGVEGILGVAGVPKIIPSAFVLELIGREMKGEFDYVKDGPLPNTAKVIILEGKYEGLIAILTGQRGGHIRCRPQGHAQEVKVPLAFVSAA